MRALPIKSFNKEILVAGDKSITHRAIMFNSMAQGHAVIKNALLGEDCLFTIDCMRKLGAEINTDVPCEVRINGLKQPNDNVDLYVGNSGTTLRLLTGLLSGLNIHAKITGDNSIQKRPLKRVSAPLSEMGAKITTTNGCAPAEIYPASLHGIEYEMPVLSAQVKSAILLAGLNAEGETCVSEGVKTRNHTEIMLKAMGADMCIDGNIVKIKRSKLHAVNIDVPADISSAAYFMVLGAVLKDSRVLLKNVGINPTRTGIIDVLIAAGGNIELLNLREAAGEAVADIEIKSAEIKPFEIGGDIIPKLIDEIPVLCVLACFSKGTSIIRDAAELRVKESDRIEAIALSLRALGGDVETREDGLVIHGKGGLKGGASVQALGDHRIAMSMYIAGLLSEKGAEIENAEVAAVSFPDFYTLF